MEEWDPSQKVRRRGQKPEKPFHYVELVHHILGRGGAQLSDCLRVVYDYDPWFPEEGTLNEEGWGLVQKNTEKTNAKKWVEDPPINFDTFGH